MAGLDGTCWPVGLTAIAVPRLGYREADWDALVTGSATPSPFLRSWWLVAAAGAGSQFLLVLDGEELVGGVAFEERPLHRVIGERAVSMLRFLGDGPLCPDHLDLLALRGREDDVVAAVAAWFRRPGSRVIDLRGAAADARIRTALPAPVWREVMDNAAWAPLPSTFAEYLDSMPPIMQNSIRRARRRFAQEGFHVRRVPDDGFASALGNLRRLHASQWGSESRFLSAFETFAAAARSGATRGEVVLFELTDDRTVLAVDVVLVVGGRASIYQGGRDDSRDARGAGTVLMAAEFEYACDSKLTEVDLLRGDEPYKRLWVAQSRPLERLRAAHGVAARAVLLAAWGRRRVLSFTVAAQPRSAGSRR